MHTGTRPRRAVIPLAFLTVAACLSPVEVTPLIPVNPRAAGRFGVFFGKEPSTPAQPVARVHVMAEGEQLGGPNAIGRPGDLLLENAEIAVVIDRIGSGA